MKFTQRTIDCGVTPRSVTSTKGKKRMLLLKRMKYNDGLRGPERHQKEEDGILTPDLCLVGCGPVQSGSIRCSYSSDGNSMEASVVCFSSKLSTLSGNFNSIPADSRKETHMNYECNTFVYGKKKEAYPGVSGNNSI
ncbi:hypothetical protein LOAG_11063 [Loa loa]|uniref:Uncharacterized protein n=1 Tax=Loa loa TaxID=7209 RepID=A0A1S0TP77_LOALO|nr:hypothetical protein LOAG_11063 [Loa loa]EFO17435.1 hypothetical protein LOAG_11063 [Loa loa]